MYTGYVYDLFEEVLRLGSEGSDSSRAVILPPPPLRDRFSCPYKNQEVMEQIILYSNNTKTSKQYKLI